MNYDTRVTDSQIREAVKFFWTSRDKQLQKQVRGKRPDQGARAAVTAGKQMAGFSLLISNLLFGTGLAKSSVHCDSRVELPGFYRGTKKWDLLVIHQHTLIAVIEVKSHIGSFGNNLNNRVEEAIGSATDIWTAFRDGKFGTLIQPWLGYLILVEESAKSTSPVSVKEPHFEVFPEFKGASYIDRYEIFCSKLVRERLYSHAALITSQRKGKLDGDFKHPSEELSISQFLVSLTNHVKTSMERLQLG